VNRIRHNESQIHSSRWNSCPK